MPTLLSHTHCQVAQSSPATQNLPKSMSGQRTVVARKDLPEIEKNENLTKCIVNALLSHFQLSQQLDTLVILESASALTIHGRCG